MKQSLLDFDQSLFRLLNQDIASPVLDSFMIALTWLGDHPWLLAPLGLLFFIKRKKDQMTVAFFLVLVLALSDGLSTWILKPWVARPRPLFVEEGVRVLQDTWNLSRFCFPSNHASNIVALSTFLSLVYRKRFLIVTLGVVSALVCFSRVYVGVHYPLDVVAGAALGGMVGWLVFRLYKKYQK